jgi:hypothetical protein
VLSVLYYEVHWLADIMIVGLEQSMSNKKVKTLILNCKFKHYSSVIYCSPLWIKIKKFEDGYLEAEWLILISERTRLFGWQKRYILCDFYKTIQKGGFGFNFRFKAQ